MQGCCCSYTSTTWKGSVWSGASPALRCLFVSSHAARSRALNHEHIGEGKYRKPRKGSSPHSAGSTPLGAVPSHLLTCKNSAGLGGHVDLVRPGNAEHHGFGSPVVLGGQQPAQGLWKEPSVGEEAQKKTKTQEVKSLAALTFDPWTKPMELFLFFV